MIKHMFLLKIFSFLYCVKHCYYKRKRNNKVLEMREKDERERESQQGRKKKLGYAQRMDKISTSFFVTNFPEEVGWGDLWKLFARYGSVSDVFIPKKVDKRGRKFGFVKFKEVKEVELLSRSLEDVWWKTYKLRINKALFGKEDKKEDDTTASNPPNRLLVAGEQLVKNDLSFKSMLLGKEDGGGVKNGGVAVSGDGGRKKMRVLGVADIIPLEVPVHEATLCTLRQSMVGFFKETMDFQSFYDRLIVEGQLEVKATFMGGNMVLLQSSCEDEMKEVMRINKQWWDQCFLKIIPWKPNILSESRDIWIQIYGLPLHAWEEGSFKMVAGRFGVFLDFDEVTVAKRRLDVARVKLRTVRRGMIDTVLQLMVLGVVYDVWVVEERCGCGDERNCDAEEATQSLEGGQSNSGVQGWKGEDPERFSDGQSDSDCSGQLENMLGKQVETITVQLAVTGTKERLGNIDPKSQNLLEVMVGESLSGNPMEDLHVVEEGECLAQLLCGEEASVEISVRGAELGPAVSQQNVLQKECVGPVVVDHVDDFLTGDPYVAVEEVRDSFGPVGPPDGYVELLGEQEAQEERGVGSNNVGEETGLVQLDRAQETDEVESYVGEVEGVVKNNEVIRISQLSENSSGSTHVIEAGNKKRNSRKDSHHHARLIPPLLGVPKFRQLEMAVNSLGKRRKEVSRSISQSGDGIEGQRQLQEPLTSTASEEISAIDLQVVLPMPTSGINLIVNNDGAVLSDSLQGSGDDSARKIEEAGKLLDIQKKVGFTFDVGDSETQSKLVELDDLDRMRNVDRVQDGGS
jgi:hypothetical protein